MGFTDRIAGLLKKKESGQEEAVSLENLDAYIASRIQENQERITGESEIFLDKILKDIDDLAEILENLREKEREEMFKKLDSIVKSSQKQFADSLKHVLERVRLERKDYQGLTEFHQQVSDALQQMQKLSRMHGRYLHLAFEREMKTFNRTVKELATYHHLLGRFLNSQAKDVVSLQHIREQLVKRRETEALIKTLEREKEQTGAEVRTVEAEILQLETHMKERESSEEYGKLLAYESHQNAVTEELASVEKEVYNILHPLDRDFRKFKRQVELGNVSFSLDILEEYEPLTEQFFTEEEGYPTLKKIASTMKEALEKQVIKEKGHKKEKVLDILDTILKDELVRHQKRYSELKKELEKQPIKKDIVKDIEVSRRSIEEKRSKIEDLKSRIEDLTSKAKNARKELGEIESEIGEQCRAVGLTLEE
ncbi:MAG: hypothetical protein HXS52_13615 [Theionarchaea archaeon]|nr:hypothetical protein [Theionarchaea archaeon]MBU7038963.1 hypothetical protein [Theionarchaea archaeon]